MAGHGRSNLKAEGVDTSSRSLASCCLEILKGSAGALCLLTGFMQAALMNLQGKLKAQQENVSKRLLQETNQEKEVGDKNTEKTKENQNDASQALGCFFFIVVPRKGVLMCIPASGCRGAKIRPFPCPMIV